MKTSVWTNIWHGWKSQLFTPKDFVKRAVMIGVMFGIAHLLGLREYASFLNGTTGSVDMNWQAAVFFGLVYVTLYFGVIVISPIFLIAALLQQVWQKLFIKA